MRVDRKWTSRFFIVYLIDRELYFFRKIDDPYWTRHQILVRKDLKNIKCQRAEHFNWYRLPIDATPMYW